MAITLGSNIASLQAQRQLFKTEQNLSSVFERLSSGQRINRASDDAAGLAISESLNTDRRVYNQAIRNLNDGLSVLNIADSTVEELSGIVIRIQELAEQAANGSLSSTQRESLDAEAQELRDEFFRVSRSADFNGLRLFDGSIENGVRLQAGYGEDGSIFSSLGGRMGDGTFELSQSYSVGDQPYVPELADLNGDGHLDLLSSNFSSNDISVLLGNGDGTFRSAITVGNGLGSQNLETADVNNDGVLDLVAGSASSGELSVLLGAGDGTFGSQQTFTGLAAADEIMVADLTGDGIVDAVLVDTSGDEIGILIGAGDGSFSTVTTLAGGSNPKSLKVGDFNSDGALDLVFGNASGDTVSLFLNSGTGSFLPRRTFTVDSDPNALSVGDFNNDGRLDVAAASFDNFTVSVLLGNGDGTFSDHLTSTGREEPTQMDAADFDGDGVLDLITGNDAENEIVLFRGLGDGTFENPVTYDGGLSPRGIAIGDVDEDGVLDFVSASLSNDTLLLFSGNTREGLAPILEFSLKTQADALQALAPLERKLQSLSEQRGTIGAFQSRLQSALNTLSATSENYAAAESRIRDADIAFESSQLTRLNILQQASAAVLGQANLQPALALQLLGDG